MKTAYDWFTVLIFAALVTKFLQRSVKADADDDNIWHYFVASVGCGGSNWLGNNGWHWSAVAVIG
ncbi:MAG: XrtV sorting system accessory protein, partial [Sphingomicrobium sp.]